MAWYGCDQDTLLPQIRWGSDRKGITHRHQDLKTLRVCVDRAILSHQVLEIPPMKWATVFQTHCDCAIGHFAQELALYKQYYIISPGVTLHKFQIMIIIQT